MSTTLEDSSTYQWILRKGEERSEGRWRVAEARTLLLRQGSNKLGPPKADQATRLQAMDDLAHLERLAGPIFEATS